jgi:hypothetical protein
MSQLSDPRSLDPLRVRSFGEPKEWDCVAALPKQGAVINANSNARRFDSVAAHFNRAAVIVDRPGLYCTDITAGKNRIFKNDMMCVFHIDHAGPSNVLHVKKGADIANREGK